MNSSPHIPSTLETEPPESRLLSTEPQFGYSKDSAQSFNRKRRLAVIASVIGSFFWLIVAVVWFWMEKLQLTATTSTHIIGLLVISFGISAASYVYFKTSLCQKYPLSFSRVNSLIATANSLLMLLYSIMDSFGPTSAVSIVLGMPTLLAFFGLTHGGSATIFFGSFLIPIYVVTYALITPAPLTLNGYQFAIGTLICVFFTFLIAGVNELNRRNQFTLIKLLNIQRRQVTIIQAQKDELDRKTTELTTYNEVLRQISLVDGLTQVANRRCFDDMLRKEWVRAVRHWQNRQATAEHLHGASLALILVDIDYFKKYNDHYGHLAGDECLVVVADAIRRATLRLNDLAARYGGEEFAVLLPETDIDGAEQVANRILEYLDNLAIPHPASEIGNQLTVSIGVAHVANFEGISEKDLIRLADKALYEAKSQGRNRVIMTSRS